MVKSAEINASGFSACIAWPQSKRMSVQQHQRLQIVSYFVILKAGVPAFIEVFFVSHLPKCTIDAGEARLPAQVFRLKLILSAVLDEMRSALAELEIDTLPDALFTDVEHPQ